MPSTKNLKRHVLSLNWLLKPKHQILEATSQLSQAAVKCSLNNPARWQRQGLPKRLRTTGALRNFELGQRKNYLGRSGLTCER
jgi:hypothetical protein